jgi:hypothetical protein
MMEKFEWEHGHEMDNRKAHKDKSNTSTSKRKGGESKISKNGCIFKLKLRQDDNQFEVKIYEMGQTMEEVSEG